ncbi:hypothetical protein ASG73_05130 [Janibacter sp. Soil728]|nr:hypothetical protein ASG73_05130 [Janibacter sp. Soil728]
MSRGSGTREATEERFAERAAQVRAHRVRRWAVGLLVVAVLLGLGWVIGFSSALDTREVAVTGADPADRRQVERIAEDEIGTPLVRVDGDALSRRIMDEVPGAAHVSVDSGWPHTLNVKVTSRVPALAVRAGGGAYRLLDLEGVVIRTVSSAPSGVPTVSADGEARVSGHGVRAAQGMLASMPQDLRRKVTGIAVDSADQISFTLGSTQIIWGDAQRPDVKVKVIKILLAKKPEVIDVSAPDTPVTKG